MQKILKNKYFLLRHGKNIHQAKKKGIVYYYPDDSPPCELIEEGIAEAKKAGKELITEKIDLIISSDTLRTRQTSEIVASIIGYDKNMIRLESKLRDKNWGIFGGKEKEEVWNYYGGEKIKAFDIAPENGESWIDCQNRIIEVFKCLECQLEKKKILIVSHSNPLWLLDGYLKGLTKQELLDNYGSIISTGEIRKL